MSNPDIQAWQQADQLFARLLELPAGQRQQHLAAAAVSPTVRERVRQLLALSTTQPPWLQRIEDRGGIVALSGHGVHDGPEPALTGRRIGRWQISGELGRGGMAVVFKARRSDGAVDQEAALKLLTTGTLGAQGAEQFQRETDILARLQHPHIVGLLDAGVCDDGTPWLAMPLVSGQRIDHWCREHAADTRQVLVLVLQVCDAVACAHRNLVIHRDLKPSNVLVDGDGQARLLDFGIARLTDQPGATGTQWLALTPQFAAPEQFHGAAPSTAMDIYGLGALLYCLLTGQAPRTGADTLTRPSLVAAADPALTGRHRRALRQDLDRVVLKALAHEPDRRYATVAELAADLRRWLSGRPVHATPPGRLYRLRKFVARHRIGVAASLALALALAGGVAATLWQAGQARNQAERAVAVRDLLVGILQAGDPTTQGGDDPPASELLRRGADQVRDSLADNPHLRAELLQVIGGAQLNRSQLDDAARSLDDALALHQANLIHDPQQHALTLFHRSLLSYQLGQTGAGIDQARQALALAQRYRLEALHDRILVRLADLLVASRQLDEGREVALALAARIEERQQPPWPPDYVTALITLGRAASHEGDLEQALRWLEQAADHARALEPARPHQQAQVLNTLGAVHLDMRNLEPARAALTEALALQTVLLGPDHIDTLTTRGNLAGALMFAGRPAEAAQQFEELLQRHLELAGGQPHPDVAYSAGTLARAHQLAGDGDRALAAAEMAWRQLAGIPETDHTYLAFVPHILGVLRLEQGQPDPERLLADAQVDCSDLSGPHGLHRNVCLAQALQAADAGQCRVPHASGPPVTPEGLDGHDRRWWAVYWLLHLRCPDADAADAGLDAGTLQARLRAFAEGAEPPFPPWLQARIQAARAAPATP